MAEKSSTTSSGIGIGSVVAAIWSWSTNASIGWCILHGVFGWGYIIYRFLGFGGGIDG